MLMGALTLGTTLQTFLADPSATLEEKMWIWQRYGTALRALYTMYEVTFAGNWQLGIPSFGRLKSIWRPVTCRVGVLTSVRYSMVTSKAACQQNISVLFFLANGLDLGQVSFCAFSTIYHFLKHRFRFLIVSFSHAHLCLFNTQGKGLQAWTKFFGPTC